MKKLLVITILFCVFACQEPPEHHFVYAFENTEDITPENITKTKQTLIKRFKTYGVTPEIEVFDNSKFKIKLNEFRLDEMAVNKMVTNKGKLEFWDTFEAKDFFSYFIAIDERLKQENKDDSEIETSILDVFSNPGYGSIMGYMKVEDTIGLLKIVNENKDLLVGEQKFVKFLFSIEENNGVALHTIKNNRTNTARLTGDVITHASQDYGYRNEPVISLEMNQLGASRWEKMTEQAFKDQTQIAIVVNDIVFSAPSVNAGAIKGGRTQISGNFTQKEALTLAVVLSGGGEIPKLKLLEYTIQAQ